MACWCLLFSFFPSFFYKSDSISWNPSPFVLSGQRARRGGGFGHSKVGGSKGLFPCRAVVDGGVVVVCVQLRSCVFSVLKEIASVCIIQLGGGPKPSSLSVSLSNFPLERRDTGRRSHGCSRPDTLPVAQCMDLHWINELNVFIYFPYLCFFFYLECGHWALCTPEWNRGAVIITWV